MLTTHEWKFYEEENDLNFELEQSATGKKLLCCAVQTGFLYRLLPFPSQKGSESCNIFIH